jgi:flavin-dependent dehydrogenase
VIHVLGGALAGCAAAITLRQHGRPVTIIEKSAFPRHKVCGEFLSPETARIFAALGVDPEFQAAAPAPIRRALLHFGATAKQFHLPETAYGLSRYALDALLLNAAVAQGAAVTRDAPLAPDSGLRIITTGRKARAPKGARQFGFKAHFEGPANDAVELYFFRGGYVGVNPVEGGRTNVCGLARDELLKQDGRFDAGALAEEIPALRQRLGGLRPVFDWMYVGPLVYANRFHEPPPDNEYFAGDALSFIDPFTGSGMLGALSTGRLAGQCAAAGVPPGEYQRQAQLRLGRPFAFSGLLRKALEFSWAGWAAHLAPGAFLFKLSRP